MSTAVENTRILVVDTSPAMLEVLKNFSNKHGYDVDSHSDPAVATVALNDRFKRFGPDYRCVMLGWPQGDAVIVKELLYALASPDHQDLPLLIVCQEKTPELMALVKKRPKTTALLWKDYQSASEIIDRLPVARVAESEPQQQATARTSGGSVRKSALLVDNAPSVCHTLKEMMQSNGYQVTVATSSAAARQMLQSLTFDLVVTDYHLHGDKADRGIESFCAAARQANRGAVVAVVSGKYTDSVIKHSLSAGAATCLFKSESTELLFARIDALTRNLIVPVATQVAAEPKQIPKVKQQVLKSQPAVNSSAIAATQANAIHSPAAKQPDKAPVIRPREKASEPKPAVAPVKDNTEKTVNSTVTAVSVGKPEFEQSLGLVLAGVADQKQGDARYSVLMLDVQLVAATGDRLSIGDSEPMRKIVHDRLSRLYKRENSLSYLGDGQFAFILATHKFQDALMLTRKVLEVVPRMIRYLNNMGLVSHASVVQIDGSCTDTALLLTQCRAACARTRKDQRDNCALVMPMKKYLTALASEQAA